MKRIIFLLFLASRFACPETVFDLSKEVIRGTAELEDIREANDREFKNAKTTEEQFATMIHMSTQMVSALQTQIYMLKAMHFDDENATEFADLLVKADGAREMILTNMKQICVKFISKQDPSFDYGALAAKFPELRADLEGMNKSVAIELTPGIILIMLQPKDGQQWLLNREEKNELISRITSSFGAKLTAKEPNWYVLPGVIMRKKLREVKASDE